MKDLFSSKYTLTVLIFIVLLIIGFVVDKVYGYIPALLYFSCAGYAVGRFHAEKL